MNVDTRGSQGEGIGMSRRREWERLSKNRGTKKKEMKREIERWREWRDIGVGRTKARRERATSDVRERRWGMRRRRKKRRRRRRGWSEEVDGPRNDR